ncbi:MAG: prolyl oligopeptidase family serine peptidase, partial [Acidobacteria bacterium]|nr:prolyl oligopeptidase family serine peptidase [Acidobacteriota bacterium]
MSLGQTFAAPSRSGRQVHGTIYRPTPSGRLAAATPDDEDDGRRPPPLLVWAHGGPTSSSTAGLDLTVQFFTTQGFAVACVDYAGSSGYGRAYREALRGQWGVADAQDCLDAARHLAGGGEVDGTRMAVRGSSAGG